ncbi:MAG: DUF58 domain-containing protein [Dehalococcoidia bacterium]
MRGRVLWTALAVILLLLGLATSSSMLYRLLFAMLAVPLFGYLASVLSARRLEGTVRRITPFLQVGETLEEELSLSNLHWFPKLLLEAEHQTAPFGSSGRVLTLWPYQDSTWTVRKHLERRGVYEFGVMTVTSRDPLGLFNRTLQVGTPQTALIYPATVELPGFYVPSGRGYTEGMVKGRTFTPSAIASTVREYVAGDSVGHIHWPSTAHMGKLMVKEFDREPSGPADAIWIVLDLDASVQAGEGTESTIEYGVTIAGSIAKRFIETGRTVGMVMGGAEHTVLKPATGLEQLGRALELLALAQEGRVSTLMHIANAVAEELTAGASVVVISAAPVSEVLIATNAVQNAGGSPVPIILEASSFRGAPHARGEQYRFPGTETETYVIHMGDELERRLDRRVHGPTLPEFPMAKLPGS